MGTWQPIETAPRDGTKVMVWGNGFVWPEIIYYEGYDTDLAAEVGEDGYWRYADGHLADVYSFEIEEISHWQPLPEPPSDD